MNTFDRNNYPVVDAVYHPSPLKEYAGNPLIEALPPLGPDEEALADICWQPTLRADERYLPTAYRIARLLELRNLMIPLDRHVEFVHKVNAMLRSGYAARGPHSRERALIAQRLYEMRQKGQSFREAQLPSSQAMSGAILSIPGMGKTTAVKRWCETLPEVIYHPQHHVYQVPVLKTDAPSNGSSLKGFCYSLLHQLDARIPGATYVHEYGVRPRGGADVMLTNVVRLLNTHFLGMLVLDETQNFANSHKGDQVVMTEIVSAFNTLQTPILFLGTNKAYSVFERDFRGARRIVSVPFSPWERLSHTPSQNSPDEWTEVVQKLWEFQWVRSPAPLDHWIVHVLYECSQGILAIAVALFAATQMRAMIDGNEKITSDSIQQVYQSLFYPVHPMISALSDGNEAALQRYLDIAPPLSKVLDRVWSAGSGSPALDISPNEPKATVTDLADERAKRKANIATRVPSARGKRIATREPEQPTPEVEIGPTDYRYAVQTASAQRTSVYDQMLKLGHAATTQELVSLLS